MSGGFRDEILGGDGGITLVREHAQSEGFITGAAGWRISRNGDAEFNNVTIRGRVIIGDPTPGNNGIDLSVQPPSFAIMRMFSGNDDEQFPAQLSNLHENPNTTVTLQSSGITSFQGITYLELVAPDTAGIPGGRISLDSTASGANTDLYLGPTMQIRMDNTTDASVSSTNHAFQIGPSTGQNIIADGNEIMARDNGAFSPLNLNNNGGDVHCGGDLGVDGTLTADSMRTGTAVTPAPGAGGGQSSVAVNFANALPATPRIFLTPNISAAGTAVVRSWGFTAAASTGFTAHCDRADNVATTFHWLAISGMG